MSASQTASTLRLPYFKLSPAPYKAFQEASAALKASALGHKLVDLVYLRVSQMNGCAYCVDLHFRDLMAAGEDPRRINSVTTWHETEFFTPRERAALRWAEAVTRIGETHAPDADFAPLKDHFSEAEITDLTFAIALMNAWNRLAIGFRQPVPAHVPPPQVPPPASSS
jgi:AhpD family alkylhydroperoxidase